MKLLTSLFCLLLIAATGRAAAQSSLLDYDSIHHPVYGDRGMVVSQNQVASQVGAEILAAGGNAVDAAVATAFALAVTLPRAGNIGGGGFMLIHLAKQNRTLAIDYRGTAPAAARTSMFLDAANKKNRDAKYGHRASAVPGTVAGLALAHRKYGSLPWPKLVQPAIRLAGEGIVVTRDLSQALRWGKRRLSSSRAALEVFFKAEGEAYGRGELLRQPDLAWTLSRIAKEGPEDFYTGLIAQRIVADMDAHRGLISLDDLAAYRAREREPLRTTYRGHEVVTMPPASAGGFALLEMLNMLEHFNLRQMGHNSAATLHILSEVMKLAYADRTKYVGDPDFVDNPMTGFTSKAYAAERKKRISKTRATPTPDIEPGDPWPFESPDTTHFSVADAAGNLVSNTYTLGSSFGSGAVVTGAGFLLDNQMGNFALRANVAGARGYSASPANKLQPGKRMTSSMTPTMVFKQGKPYLVVGTPGGGTIINTVLQVIINVIDHDMNIAAATHAPRMHQRWRPGEMQLEPGFSADTLRLLTQLGHKFNFSKTIGSAQSILIDAGEFAGAADPRRPGAAAIGVF